MKSIPINPDLPPDFFCTPNGERDPDEIEAWWGVPFIESEPGGPYFVRCLDGGAWDRPSLLACCDSLDEAIKAAKELMELQARNEERREERRGRARNVHGTTQGQGGDKAGTR